MVIITLLVFTVDIVLITRFFSLIKQRKYNDSTSLWSGLPDYFPKIENKSVKTLLNYITLIIAVYIIGYYFPSKWPAAKALRFSFDIVIEGYRFLVSSIITTLILVISLLTRKIIIFRQDQLSLKFYYIELIIIPIIIVLSLYFFDSVFDALARAIIFY